MFLFEIGMTKLTFTNSSNLESYFFFNKDRNEKTFGLVVKADSSRSRDRGFESRRCICRYHVICSIHPFHI